MLPVCHTHTGYLVAYRRRVDDEPALSMWVFVVVAACFAMVLAALLVLMALNHDPSLPPDDSHVTSAP